MRFAIAQILIVFVSFSSITDSVSVKNKAKRAPLEVGLVNFAEIAHHDHLKLNDSVASSEIAKTQPSVASAHTHKWIPGHVKHHAYIPAHLGHLYLPAHAILLTRALLVHPAGLYSPYRSHYGGFGIGVDVGGHGAGHGFHVLFDF